MKNSFILFSTLILYYATNAAIIFDTDLNYSWRDYKQKFKKEYKSIDEENERRAIWEENLKYINQHNLEASLGQHNFTLKMNQFGDMTTQEYIDKMLRFRKPDSKIVSPNRKKFLIRPNADIPDSVDWRTEGYVTPIKDQGQCGSCWAFSAVASLEGQHFNATGNLVSLSEQNLMDCSWDYGNRGCSGGFMDAAFQYIIDNNGIDTEDSYPYEAKDGVCRFNPDTIGATQSEYVDIESGSESDLTVAIATVGPISNAINAASITFKFYSSGIYSSLRCNPNRLDHGVASVGYGSDGPGQDYYIVKNSWGTDWGEDGYVLMARNKGNMCGIASSASYPLV